jgi:ATP-dependent Clp protease ATP-binding subunit ClpA
MGARPLGRVIQEHIKKPLAEELLFGKLTKGGVVRVGVKDGKIDLFQVASSAPRYLARSRRNLVGDIGSTVAFPRRPRWARIPPA